METETLNKLYLELSQFVTAKSAREIKLEQLANARIEFIEQLFIKYHVFDKEDDAIMRAFLAEWKPENYVQYK